MHAEGRRFLRFLVVGGCAFVLETAALSIFVFALGLDRILAKGLAFVLTVLASFLGNHLWVYRGSNRTSPVQRGLAFTLVSLGGLAVNLVVFSTADRLLRDKLLTSTFSLYAAQVMAVGAALLWNFTVNRVVTYRDVRFGQ